ncbi:hypothetical protein [Burkholderia contaminans]|uniref:hypothetical protein n=1 Tax=Burkholderia contaminans TaxID=488447 RepID=UPI000F5B4A36|nr:hypothetical protein [Burkholderia contaminans]
MNTLASSPNDAANNTYHAGATGDPLACVSHVTMNGSKPPNIITATSWASAMPVQRERDPNLLALATVCLRRSRGRTRGSSSGKRAPSPFHFAHLHRRALAHLPTRHATAQRASSSVWTARRAPFVAIMATIHRAARPRVSATETP